MNCGETPFRVEICLERVGTVLTDLDRQFAGAIGVAALGAVVVSKIGAAAPTSMG